MGIRISDDAPNIRARMMGGVERRVAILFHPAFDNDGVKAPGLVGDESREYTVAPTHMRFPTMFFAPTGLYGSDPIPWTLDPRLNQDKAPNGLAGPWYVPIEEYREWEDLFDGDVNKIADHVRFGLEVSDVRAVMSARAGIRGGRSIRNLVEGWRMTPPSPYGPYDSGTNEGAEEIVKFVHRSSFMHKGFHDRYGGSQKATAISIGATSAITDYIAYKVGATDRYAEETRQVFSIVAPIAAHLLVDYSPGKYNQVISGIDQQLPGTPYSPRMIIDLAVAGNRAFSEDLDIQSVRKLIAMGLGRQDAMAALRMLIDGKHPFIWSAPREHHGLPIHAARMLKTDSEVEAMVQLFLESIKQGEANGMSHVGYGIDGDWEEVVEMVKSGVPTEWIFASSFTPIERK